MSMQTRVEERTHNLSAKKLQEIKKASHRVKRGWVADFVTIKVLNSIENVGEDAQLVVGKWQEDGNYWSGMLHKFVLDLFVGGPKEAWNWRQQDMLGFNDAWSMLDDNHNIKEEYQFSWLLYDHLGVDRGFLSATIFWGLETCGIITDRLNVQSTILSQWEAESGVS